MMGKGKRLFDLVIASGALMLLSPVFAAIAVAIKLDEGGPVFFRQVRVGRNGRHFRIWKFRTMVTDAERRGPQLTMGVDPRVTRVGAWLRRAKFDEIPQFINVLTGEMSLVGPRPEVPRYVELSDPNARKILELVPGIFHAAWLYYPDEGDLLAKADDPERYYLQDLLPEKYRINLEYEAHANVFTDAVLIIRTLFAIPGAEMNDTTGSLNGSRSHRR
jgi:lipopolysaccharide/colanic/teichoic acid biosynthesis glycosyltransferase